MGKEQEVTNRHISEQEKYYRLQYMEKEQKVTNRHILEQVSLCIPHVIHRYLRTEVSLFAADTKN